MFRKNKSIYKHLDFMLMDYALLILSFLIAYISRIGSLSTLLDSGRYRLLVMLMVLVNIVVDFFYEPYKNILRRSYLKEIKEVLVYVLLNLLLISLIVFWPNLERSIPGWLFLLLIFILDYCHIYSDNLEKTI